MTPRVSVIVPLFESGATVAQTLESLLTQTLPDWEAIVVNDGSTDDGPAIAESYAGRDPRIRVVHQRNAGLAGARNRGIDSAEGAFVHFLDADDALRPRALARLVELASSSRQGAAACGWSCVGPAMEQRNWTLAPPRSGFGLNDLLDANRAVVHAMIIARETLGERRFDESLPVLEDYDLWLRLGALGVRWTTTDEALALYRMRPDSMSRATRTMWETTRRVLGRAYAGVRWGLAEVDGSGAREARTLSAMALTHAAVLAPRDQRGASAILDEAPGASWRDPALIARTLHGALPLGFGLPPSAWRGADSEPLFATAREWAPDAFGPLAPGVLARLASLTVEAAQVARQLTDRIDPRERVTIAGAGRNGAVVAEALAHRGVRFDVWDDDPDASARLAGAFAAPSLTELADSSAPVVIVTPGDDDAIVPRISRGHEVRRWSVVAHDQSRAARARLAPVPAVRAA